MARIFQDGFEIGRPQPPGSTTFGDWLGSLWQFNQTTTIALDSRHIGVQSHTTNGGNYALEMYKASTAAHQLQVFRDLENELVEHYGRVEFYLSSAITALNATLPIVHFRDDSYDQVVASIRVEKTDANTVNILIFIAGTQVASYPDAFLCDVWTRLEWRLLVDGSNGVFEVRRNGDSLLLFEGNTDPHGTGHMRYLCLGTPFAMTQTFRMHFDDVAVNDTLGDINNSWPGRGRIIYLKPRGDGEHTDWYSSEQSANFSFHLVEGYLCSSLNSPTANLSEHAFDESSTSFWRPVGTAGEWVGFELKVPAILNRLWIGGQTSIYSIADIRIEGSHEGELWDNLAEAFINNNGISQEYDFINTTAYKYYRIYVVSSRAGRAYLYDARFYQAPAESWAALIDIPDDGGLSRNWSDVFGNKISCLTLRMAEDLGYDPASEIRTVQHLMKGRFIDGEAELKAIIRLGSDETDSEPQKLMNNYLKYHQQIWEKNPFTNAAWTRSELDDLEAGVEHKEVD